ncbi:MAG: PQQ-binding-like beta-propeller repeat protein [candidate division WOR-3 bacterium]
MFYILLNWIVRIDGSIDTLDRCYSLEIINNDVIIGGNYGNNLFLAKLNGNDGSIIWQKILSFSGYGRNNIKAIRIDPLDNNIAVAGTVYPFSNSSTPCGYVAKFRSDNGNLIWQYIDQDNQSCSNGGFISSERYGFSDLIIGPDNNYYAVGSDFEIWFDGAFSNSARYIVKVNRSTGQRIFRNSPGGFMYKKIKSIDNSSVIAVGHGDRGEVQKFSINDGSIIWSNTYSTSSRIYAVDKLANGNIVVGGWKNDDFYVGLLNNNDGSILAEWTKNGAGNSLDILNNLVSIGNDIYAVGYLNNGFTGNDAYIVKLNQLLNVVWQKTLNNIPNSNDYFLSIKTTSDNKLLVGGTLSYSITGNDFVIYKLDPTTGDTIYTFKYDYNGLIDIAYDFKDINDTLYACGISYSTTNNADIVVIKWNKPTNIEENIESKEFIQKSNKLKFLKNGLVEIYHPDGKVYKKLFVKENEEMTIKRGFFIMKFNSKTYKIIIR